MRPKIGILGTISGSMFGVDTKYMQFASMFGDVCIITPDHHPMDLNLLILKGGHDINPANYGQRPGYAISTSNPFQEEFDNEWLPQYITKEIPIFGICRGLQALNIHFGGTLNQHIVNHPTNGDDREELTHNVRASSPKSKMFGVNSMHHQAIDKLGEGLEVMLEECDDKGRLSTGIIEAIKHKTLPIIAVQWHPEEMLDSWSTDAVKSLIKLD